MPGYEYICDKCHRNFTVFISYHDYGKKKAACPTCGSIRVTRTIGRVRLGKSRNTRLQEFSEMADPQNLDGLENNPVEMGRMMKKLSREIGKDIGPEFNEVVDRLESGQTTDEIDANFPDLNSSGKLHDST